ncbi:Phosphatidylcholine:diacylglycerol cholinephosphotransferase 1 [Senna tora]|uniref:Phosphatidylcholine:diacylglycerol cholinephosphotransferase 1 n=1 Tax=Senna tora TaxID=362788 RepID=A0A834WRH5_9FABA|nr:Phosphatidylcholine:diacylglycerol cholinephosphotransferase 1 [Senna tora]
MPWDSWLLYKASIGVCGIWGGFFGGERIVLPVLFRTRGGIGSEIVGDKKKALYHRFGYGVGVGDDVVHNLLDSGDEGDSHKR